MVVEIAVVVVDGPENVTVTAPGWVVVMNGARGVDTSCHGLPT